MSLGPFDRGSGLRRRWLLGWEGRIGRLDWSVTPSSLNLPRLRVYRDGEGGTSVVLSWGNGNCDDLWSLAWRLR